MKMFQKFIYKALFGFVLIACMNAPSYAVNEQGSIMKVVAKAAVDGGDSVVKGALYVVQNPVSATKNAYAASKTVVGAVVTAIGGTIENAWGYLVEVKDPEAEDEDGKLTYVITAITDAKEQFVDGAYELSATLYDAVEPTVYLMKQKFITYTGGDLSDWTPGIAQKVFDSVVEDGGELIEAAVKTAE